MNSGSEADASQRLFRMKMLGLDDICATLWKNFFSCKKKEEEQRDSLARPQNQSAKVNKSELQSMTEMRGN